MTPQNGNGRADRGEACLSVDAQMPIAHELGLAVELHGHANDPRNAEEPVVALSSCVDV